MSKPTGKEVVNTKTIRKAEPKSDSESELSDDDIYNHLPYICNNCGLVILVPSGFCACEHSPRTP